MEAYSAPEQPECHVSQLNLVYEQLLRLKYRTLLAEQYLNRKVPTWSGTGGCNNIAGRAADIYKEKGACLGIIHL